MASLPNLNKLGQAAAEHANEEKPGSAHLPQLRVPGSISAYIAGFVYYQASPEAKAMMPGHRQKENLNFVSRAADERRKTTSEEMPLLAGGLSFMCPKSENPRT